MTSKFGIGVAVALTSAVGLGGAAWLTQGVAFAEPAQAAPLADSTQHDCSRAQEAANKKLMLQSLEKPQEYYDLMHPDYIQHNPDALRFEEINHLHGRDAMAKLLQTMAKSGFNGPPPDFLGKRTIVIAECDLVMVLREVQAPDPQHAGKTYTAYGFEMFRVKDGKLYEHWDDARIADPPPVYLTAPIKDLKP